MTPKIHQLLGHCSIPHSNCTPGNGEATHTLTPTTHSSTSIVEDALLMLTKNYVMLLTLCPSVTCCTVVTISNHSAVYDHRGSQAGLRHK